MNKTKIEKLNINLAVEGILSVVPERNRAILAARYGVGASGERKTLESIGNQYSITRERVRQIEESSYKKIRNSDEYEKFQPVMDDISDIISERGGVATEEDLIESLDNKDTAPYLFLALAISPNVFKIKENNKYNPSWVLGNDTRRVKSVYKLLDFLSNHIEGQDKLMNSNDLLGVSQNSDIALDLKIKEDNFEHILSVSKTIKKSPLGLWGLHFWPSVSPRGVRDKAFLVCEKHQNPLHFRDIATMIDDIYTNNKKQNKKTHPQTVHNELIKDKSRFARVGRGIYALKSRGYEDGTVKDVIIKALGREEGKGLSRDDLIESILRQRIVKESTILLNLQDRKLFKKDSDNRYYLA